MMNTRSNPPWKDLPQVLLITIANFLTSNPIDILTFRAICKSWNSASPPFSPVNLSPVLPLTCEFVPSVKFDRRFDYPISIPRRPIFSITAIFALRQKRFSNMEQDKKCWLMFSDQLTPGKFMIRQPLTKYHYSIPLNFPSGLYVPNIHVDEVARFYNLSFHPDMNRPPSMWSEHVQKVVVNYDDSRAFVLFHTGRVGSLKLMMDPFWYAGGWDHVSPFGFKNNGVYNDVQIDDIVYHKWKLWGVDHVGRVYVRDFSSSTEKTIVSPITGSCTKRKRLVESNGLVYLVVREEANGGLGFKVFELDENLDEWVEVASIGDMVFFFGLDFSFSISPYKLGGSFREDCIVFVEHSFKDYDDGVVDDVLLFSNLSYGDLRVCVWHMDEDPYHCGPIGSYPGYSNVLWPPPTWLWSIDMAKRIGNIEAELDDDDLLDASAEKLKTMTKLPPLKEAIVVNGNANQQDSSEIWRIAQTVQVYLNEAKDFHKQLESLKVKNVVSKQHDQAGSSSRGIELQGSVNSETGADAFISSQMKLNSMLLHLEETTTKLQNILKSRQKPSSVDAVE